MDKKIEVLAPKVIARRNLRKRFEKHFNREQEQTVIVNDGRITQDDEAKFLKQYVI